MRTSEELTDFLERSVLGAINSAISNVTTAQVIGEARAINKDGSFHSEFWHGIEFPESIGEEGRTVLAMAFASATMAWLGYRGGLAQLPSSRIQSIVWRIEPEFAVQHMMVPAPEGFEGETFKSFIDDRPHIWGPWVAKIYMRGTVTKEQVA